MIHVHGLELGPVEIIWQGLELASIVDILPTERARSISPQKETPLSTPTSYKYSADHTNPSNKDETAAALTPRSDLRYVEDKQTHERDEDNNMAQESLEDTMDRLTGGRTPSPTKESSMSPTKEAHDIEPMRNSPSSAMPTRSGTVSWQQRPKSRGTGHTRALSVIASENAAARSPRATSDLGGGNSRPTSAYGEAAMGRDAIAQSLNAKGGDFFRQTQDGGRGSGAFRKNQVEEEDRVEGHTGAQRMQLPGMANTQRAADSERSLSPSRNAGYGDYTTSARPTSSHGYPGSKHGSIAGLQEEEAGRSRASTLTSQRLPPPAESIREQADKVMAMSPAQGRISPERPVSPTKGMGGFVQSAMMKRNDSVNKRWSVQSPGMSPRSSAALNRQSVDLGVGGAYASPRDRPMSLLSRDTTSEISRSSSRPSSSHSNAAYTTRDADASRPSSSCYEAPSSDSPTKNHPVLDPHKQSFDDLSRPETPRALETSRPLSPSKTGGDKPRWSPTKSSWLESALKKPESPKVRPAAPQAQPSWMEGISKAKLDPKEEPTNGAAKLESPRLPMHKHQVSIEGLIRSPGMGSATEKPKNISALAAKFSSGVGSPAEKRKESFREEGRPKRSLIEERKKSFANIDVGGLNKTLEKKPSLRSNKSDEKIFDEPAKEPAKKDSVEPIKAEEPIARSITPKAVEVPVEAKPSPAALAKSKFEPKPLEAGKFDFRGNLKAKVPPPINTGTNEPEFKNVFGQLRRTKTQKYEAPDVLKDNILRGKSGLAQTGGPQKTERKDEFKEAILQKKKAFEQAQADGTAVGLTKSASQIKRELPEALLKKAELGRSGSTAKLVDVPSRENSTTERPKRPEQLPFRERAKSFAKLNGEQSELARTSSKRDETPKKEDNKSATPLGVGRSYSTKKLEDPTPAPISASSEVAAPESSPEKSDAPPRHRRAKSISAKAGMFERQQPEQPLKKPSFEVPKRTIVQKDEFGPPLRRRTDAPKDEPTSLARAPSLMKEDSAPGRLQGKIAAGNKLAERFNPALANLLARGPPAPGSESPVKSTDSAPAVEAADDTPGEGPQLTHMTKARARGPKRKAPSSAAAAIAVPSDPKATEAPKEEEKPKARPLPVPRASQQSLKDEATRDAASSLRSRFMEKDEGKLQEAKEQTVVEVGSPRKLNIKRRSQFLGVDGPASPAKEEIEQRSPVKSDLNGMPGQRAPRNFSPTVKPKPLSLASPPLDVGRFDPIERVITPPSRVMSPSNKSFDLGSFEFETPTNAAEEEQRRPSVVSIPSSEHGTFGNQARQTSSQRPPSVMSSIASPPRAPAQASAQREPTRVTSPPSRAGTFGREILPNPAGRKISETSYTNDKVDTESISSIKSAKSMFGQSRSENVGRAPSVREPIKLPTADDENERMIQAGLRSPDSYASKQQSMSPVLDRTSTREQARELPQLPQRETPKEFAHMREVSRELPQPPQREQSASPVYARQPFQSSGRPLPIPPLRISKTPPPAVPQPLSPSKSLRRTGSLLSSPQPSDTSKTLQEFFNTTDAPKNFSIDTSAIIEMRPNFNNPIHTLSATIYQIGGDGRKTNVPRGQERMLFEGNMYLCTHVFTRPDSPRRITEVYFWIGDEVADHFIHDAEVLALKEARAVRGELVKLRQGKESPEFIDALEGIIVVHRGVAHRFDATRPMMLCARSYAGRIVFDEVDYSPLSLCSGYPYIVSTSSGKCYLWKGRGAGVDELSSARLIGMDYGMTGEIIEVEDGRESQYFLDEFGRGTIVYKSAEHWRLKPLYELYSTRLFKADTQMGDKKVRDSLSSTASLPIPASPAPSVSSWSPLALIRSRATTPEPRTEKEQLADEKSKHQIVEIAPFKQIDMDPHGIYVLDAFFELYIIVGKESRDKYDDFCAALIFAQEYGILTAGMEDRPFVPVSTVVLEGVPRDMKGVFRKWRDAVSPLIMKPRSNPLQMGGGGGGLKRGKSLRVVRLNDALDAVRL